MLQNDQLQDTSNLFTPEGEGREIDVGTRGRPSPILIDPRRNDEQRDVSGGASFPEWPTTATRSTQATEGYEIIAQELQFREHLSTHKRQVLESAVSFISQLPQRPRIPSTPTPTNRNGRDEIINGISIPSTEFLCWMIHGKVFTCPCLY